jgi:hypothetical protein
MQSIETRSNHGGDQRLEAATAVKLDFEAMGVA